MPSASNLEQAANLLCAQANSASYHQRDGKWVVAHGLWGEGLVRWLRQWYVCVLHCGSNCSPSRAMDGRIMRHGIISSCQSAATSEIVKRCCSSLVSSAVTSTQTFMLLGNLFTSGVCALPVWDAFANWKSVIESHCVYHRVRTCRRVCCYQHYSSHSEVKIQIILTIRLISIGQNMVGESTFLLQGVPEKMHSLPCY